MAIYTNEGLTDLLPWLTGYLNDEYEKVRLLEEELETTKKLLDEAVQIMRLSHHATTSSDIISSEKRTKEFLAKLSKEGEE